MKIAIPVARWEGWLSPVSDHFGHAPYFAVVDCITNSIRPIEARTARKPSECAPIAAFLLEGCEAVLCRHLGRGALARCNHRGLKVYAAEGVNVADVRDAFVAGTGSELGDEALCAGGHHHDHEDGDHHDHDHGHCGHHGDESSSGPVIILPDPSKA